MKKRIIVSLTLAAVLILGWGFYLGGQRVKAQSGTSFTTKYESAQFFAQTSDGGASVKILNVGSVAHNYRVIIYEDTAPRSSLMDSGTPVLEPRRV